MGWGSGAGQGRSKKFKPIPALPRGAGLKSHPILTPSPLRGGENQHRAKQEGASQAGQGKTTTVLTDITYNYYPKIL